MQTFVKISPPEMLRAGDWITVDQVTGKLRKAVAGEDTSARSFALPPGFEIRNGYLRIPESSAPPWLK